MFTLLKSNANPIVGFFTSSEWETLEEARAQAAIAREWGRCETKIVDSGKLAAAVEADDRAAVKAFPNLDVI